MEHFQMPWFIWSTPMLSRPISWAAVTSGQSWSEAAGESCGMNPIVGRSEWHRWVFSALGCSSVTRGRCEETFQNASPSSLFLYYNSLYIYINVYIWHILMFSVFVADKRFYQTAGYITRATCAPDGGEANTTTTARLKGQQGHPIILYGCHDNVAQYELNCALSTPCFHIYSISDSSFTLKERYLPTLITAFQAQTTNEWDSSESMGGFFFTGLVLKMYFC